MSDAVQSRSTDLAGLRQRAELCAKYDFDTVEMIECKWALWDEILEALSSDGAACGDSSQASQRLSGDLQPVPSEADYLEDNIATVAHHLRQDGARLEIDHRESGKVGLLVEPGEVLREIARRLGVAQAKPERDKPPLAKLLEEVDPGLADVLTDHAAWVALIRNNTVTACANVAAGHNGVSPRDARDIAAKIRALSIPSTQEK